MTDIIDGIMDYEQGRLSDPGVLALFAELINTGMAWSLQGSYGRTATAMLEQGIIDPTGEITEIGRDLIQQYWDENPGEDVLT